MKNGRMTIWLAVAVAIMAAGAQAQDFELFDDDHLDVTSSYEMGTLWDFSTANVLAGGFINIAYVYDAATLNIKDGGAVTYLLVGDPGIGGGSVNIFGGSVGDIDLWYPGTVDIVGSSVGSLSTRGASTVDIVGSSVGGLRSFGSTLDISDSYVSGDMIIESSHVSINDSSIEIASVWSGSSSQVYLSGGGSVGSVWSHLKCSFDFSGVDVGTLALYFWCHFNITNGSVSGYVELSDGSNANIGGDVGGNALVVAHSTLDISGNLVGGIESLWCGIVHIGGSVGRNIFGRGGVMSVGGNVGGNIFYGGYNSDDKGWMEIGGNVAGTVEAWDNSTVNLHGDVNGAVEAHNESLVAVNK